jgi:CDP-diacylglycerol--glycerol-3-phosphate 3-phosphatidyltransferase
MFDSRWRKRAERATAPVGRTLVAAGVSPNQLTVSGMVIALGAGLAVANGAMILGLVLFVASALPDLLDGAVARAGGTDSRRGAFLDSVADRCSDAFVLIGIAWHLDAIGMAHAGLLAAGALVASLISSYVRAKGDALGLAARGGVLERAERIVVLGVGLLVPGLLLVPMLWVVLVGSVLSGGARFASGWASASDEQVLARMEQRWRAWRSQREALRDHRREVRLARARESLRRARRVERQRVRATRRQELAGARAPWRRSGPLRRVPERGALGVRGRTGDSPARRDPR